MPASSTGQAKQTPVSLTPAVIVVATLIFYMRRHMKRLERKAEQAYPGPLDDADADSGARASNTPAGGRRR